ncbi:MAG: GGDEF domain-containing protein [Polyangiales bacterium]
MPTSTPPVARRRWTTESVDPGLRHLRLRSLQGLSALVSLSFSLSTVTSTAVGVEGRFNHVVYPTIAALTALLGLATLVRPRALERLSAAAFWLFAVYYAAQFAVTLSVADPRGDLLSRLFPFVTGVPLLLLLAFLLFERSRAARRASAVCAVIAAESVACVLLGPACALSRDRGELLNLVLLIYPAYVATLSLIARAAERAADHAYAARVMRGLALTDELTGVANRRAVLAALAREARDGGAALAVVTFDIDHFKSINDRHGHATGDAVLRGVAAVATATVRGSDRVGRVGGEEFLVLLRGADEAEATRVAERLREGVAAMRVDGAPAVTASFGVARLREGEGTESLLRRADAALYAAKSSGRNAVSVSEGALTTAP